MRLGSCSLPETSIFLQISSGLLKEVHHLRSAGLGHASTPAALALGYRQTLAWFDRIASQRTASAADIRQLVLDIAGPSRRLRKAQITFHRDLEYFHWIDADAGPLVVADYIAREFKQDQHQGAELPQHCCRGAM